MAPLFVDYFRSGRYNHVLVSLCLEPLEKNGLDTYVNEMHISSVVDAVPLHSQKDSCSSVFQHNFQLPLLSPDYQLRPRRDDISRVLLICLMVFAICPATVRHQCSSTPAQLPEEQEPLDLVGLHSIAVLSTRQRAICAGLKRFWAFSVTHSRLRSQFVCIQGVWLRAALCQPLSRSWMPISWRPLKWL